MNRSRFAALIAGAAISILAVSPANAQGQTLFYTAGVPIAPATQQRPLVNVMRIAGVKISATVNDLEAIRPARPGMPAETPAQASQRKAAAIVASANVAIQAEIAAGRLPANTPMAFVTTEPATIHVRHPVSGLPLYFDQFGRLTTTPTLRPHVVPNNVAGFGVVNIPGVTEVLGPKDGSRDPTGEPGGPANFRPAGGTGGGAGGSMGGLGGTGASSMRTLGTDATGMPSSISFGFINDEAYDAGCSSVLPPVTSCPGGFIATLHPGADRDEAGVLGDLASLFNSLFGTLGLSATYDPINAILALDAPLTPFEALLVQNTDPGLELTMVLRLVPEPAALALFGAGLVALGLALRRRPGYSTTIRGPAAGASIRSRHFSQMRRAIET